MAKKTICILTLIFIMSVISISYAVTDGSDPDFSMPEQQSREQLQKLASALAQGDSKEAARAAILYEALLAVKDGDSIQVAIDTLTSVAADKRVGAPVRALVNLYVANLYADIYNARRWVYDERHLPLEPIPSGYDMWSGEQFRYVIMQYLDKAFAESPELKTAPLAEYSRICGLEDKKNLIYYPTVYDFAAYKSISLLKSLNRGGFRFSQSMLSPCDIFIKDKFEYQPPAAKRILELYRSLLEFHRGDAAPLIWADVNRIEFIASNVQDSSAIDEMDDDDMDLLIEEEKVNTPSAAYGLLIDLARQWNDSPYASEALVSAGSYLTYKSPTNDIDEYCGLARRQLKAWPSHTLAGCLENKVNELLAQHVFIDYPSAVVPGKPLHISVRNYNTPAFELKIYKIPYAWNGNNSYRMKKGNRPPLVSTIKMRAVGTAPFHAVADTSVVFDKPGCYIVVPSFPDGSNRYEEFSSSYVHCSELSLQTAAFGPERWVMVVNPLTGAPVRSAQVSRIETNEKVPVTVATFTTDADGTARIDDKGGLYYARKGTDSFAAPISSYWHSNYEKSRIYRVCPLTDLAIYHPGDTVRWNIVTQSYLYGEARMEPSLKVRAVLRNANYERIDTVETVTDDWGRADGMFVLPKDVLTGQFCIQFVLTDRNLSERDNSVYFTVSDYKLPTYYVEVTDILRDVPQKGGVFLKGRVVSYSGFPIASASVSLDLKASYRGWWDWRLGGRGGDTSFYSTTLTTDDSGVFSVELPAELLKSAPVSDPIFSADFTAVSSTGESRSASASFTVGKPYIITSSLPNIIDTSKSVNLGVSMSDLTGKNNVADVRYAVCGLDRKEVASGVVSTANPVVDLSAVPGGSYTFIFSPVDSTLANSYVTSGHVLYKPTDRECPVGNVALWVPSTKQTLSDTRRASVLFGVNGKENYVHYAVYTDTVLVGQGWRKYPAGLHRFEYDMPQGVSEMTLTLSCTSDYKSKTVDVKITAPEADKSVKLSIESFRDRLVPGDKETWTFRVTDAQGRGIKAPVALDMYAKPLDELASRAYRISPSFGHPIDYILNINTPRTLQDFLSKQAKYVKCNNIGSPEFFISLAPFYGVGRMGYAYSRSIKMRGLAVNESMAMADYKMAKADSYDAGGYPVSEEAEFADDALVLNESVVASAAGATEEAPTVVADGPDAVEYRIPENPIAFFRPTLTTDDSGSLSFSFTVPNANTTWKLYAYTYTRDMAVDDLTREAIASKPVMVQPNLPRFLRNGDRALIQAAVMNNTDSAQSVVTVVEIFDPVTGTVLSSASNVDSVAPMSSSKVGTWVDAPVEVSLIGYRIRSTAGRFTDGEQAVIPVLTAIEPVVETSPFYIPPGAGEFSLKMPKMPKDARVTLQFCENPVWYVVTALPGIRAAKISDALSASAAIFSAAVAEGVLRTDPAIAEAIRMWNASDRGDSTLVSMLERNADLKTVLLSSTPWVMDARSQTERMERLSLLFDPQAISTTYAEAIKKLSALECPGGGWAWIEQYKSPSMWVTENILASMGRLSELGYLPVNSELRRMIDKALEYYDSEIEKTFKKSPKYTSPLFVLVRGYYPDKKMSATVKNFVNNTLGIESREWKSRSIPAKAIDAIILNRNNYPAVAKEIIASMRDFAVSTPERGMWWPSLDDMTVWHMGKISAASLALDAFADVVPGSADVDLIRQWLILQKEAKDWGTSVSTSDAIASILLSGSKWTRPAKGAVIKIGSRKVEVAPVDTLLGYFRGDISRYNPSSAKLTVSNLGGTPSWGAVYAQYRDRMSDIKAVACPDLSIEKELYRRVVTDSGVKWEVADRLVPGDVVQVNLTVVAARDMDYVAIVDNRGACLEPVEQLPVPLFSEGICFYRENRDSSTDMFITHMPKGTYRLSYEMYVNNAGTFSAGIASVQSQYAPALAAHSAGMIITVGE